MVVAHHSWCSHEHCRLAASFHCRHYFDSCSFGISLWPFHCHASISDCDWCSLANYCSYSRYYCCCCFGCDCCCYYCWCCCYDLCQHSCLTVLELEPCHSAASYGPRSHFRKGFCYRIDRSDRQHKICREPKNKQKRQTILDICFPSIIWGWLIRFVCVYLPVTALLTCKAFEMINVALCSHDHFESWNQLIARRTQPCVPIQSTSTKRRRK